MLVRVLRACDVRTGPQTWAVRALFVGPAYELPEEQALALIERGDAIAVNNSAPAGAAAEGPSAPPPPDAADVPSAGGSEDLSKLTVAALRERMVAAGIQAPAGAKKADLVSLLQAAEAGQQGDSESPGEE